MAEEESREIVEVRDGSDLELLVGIAEEYGVRVEKVGVRTLDPVTFVELIGTAGFVTLVIERWQDRRRGGQVIDLRAGAATPVYRDRGVLFGYVVVLLADGRVQVQTKEMKNHLTEIIDRLVTAFTSGGEEGTVDKVVSLLESLAGGEAELRIERSEQPTAGHGANTAMNE